MYIEKLGINGFGRLNQWLIDLDRGFNVVFGGNESGKTTLLWFIKGMLYGLKGGRPSKDGLIPPLRRYKPWRGGKYGGFMEYRLDDGEAYRVERDFTANSARVLKSNFHEITGEFDLSKDRGLMFTEKHLGLNESCFDKTVLVRQMDARVGTDGSRELLNRLINITQTGFEDISFKKAQEALQEAIKTGIGTGKTTTGPLNKAQARLNELKALRLSLEEEKALRTQIEAELREAYTRRDGLEKVKSALGMAKELALARQNIHKKHELKAELDRLLECAGDIAAELDQLSLEIHRCREDMDRFSGFASHSEPDAEINLEYHSLSRLKEESRRILLRLEEEKEELKKAESQFERVKAFDCFDEKIDETVLRLSREVESLKAQCVKSSPDEINEKISGLKSRKKLLNYGLLSLAALFVLSSTAFFTLPPLKTAGLALSLAVLAASAVLGVSRLRTSGELSGLTARKRSLIAAVNNISGEIARKQKELQQILSSTSASSVEDFMGLKKLYDGKVQQIDSLSGSIRRLENDLESNLRETDALKASILGKLYKAGIIGSNSTEIKEEHIAAFRQGMKKYRECESFTGYAQKKTDDLKNSLQQCYSHASSLCGFCCDSREKLKKAVLQADTEVAALQSNFTTALERFKIFLKDMEQPAGYDMDSLYTRIAGMEPHRLEEELARDMDSIGESLKAVLLKIKGDETRLSMFAGDEESLQRTDEETAELEENIKLLEHKGKSLAVALEVLTEASVEIQKDFAPALNHRMSEIIGKITDSRYSDLRADNRLLLNTVAPETGGVTPVQLLSGGTADQMYLALRIAAAGLITSQGEKLPFLLDEIFAQYDDKRTRQTLEFLKELSLESQIIFLTCKKRDVDMAREIFSEVNYIEIS
ncbi:MAG: AAA family ATPase [Clostridiales bacterium]|jgi:DNA repair exonuclease SbcCD ATPase subunit|nr:AAA family ATPase [Eubacteriales bacterium]MDH7567076.1 AAA family ATPase [Clostridiales bacterium]